MGFFLVACSGMEQVRPVESEAGLYFQRLNPRQLGISISTEQKIDANYGDRKGTFLSAVEISPEKMTIVAATATGQRLFTLHLSDKGKLDFDSGVLDDTTVKPEYIVADFQLIFWPAETIRAALQGPEWALVLKDTPRVRRELLRDGRLIVEIEYSHKNPWRGGIAFRNLQRNYSLAILNGTAMMH